MLTTPSFTSITTDLLEHTDGRPIAYTDATALAVFVYQDPAGIYVADIHTRHPDTDTRGLRVLLDGHSLPTGIPPATPEGMLAAIPGATLTRAPTRTTITWTYTPATGRGSICLPTTGHAALEASAVPAPLAAAFAALIGAARRTPPPPD